MQAELTMRQVYANHSVLDFFFRTQSENTFNELFDSVEERSDEICDAIENYSDDLDEIEEMFYNDSVEELAETFGLTLSETEGRDE